MELKIFFKNIIRSGGNCLKLISEKTCLLDPLVQCKYDLIPDEEANAGACTEVIWRAAEARPGNDWAEWVPPTFGLEPWMVVLVVVFWIALISGLSGLMYFLRDRPFMVEFLVWVDRFGLWCRAICPAREHRQNRQNRQAEIELQEV